MYFALISTDKPHSEPLRNANRPDHMEYLKALGDRLVVRGQRELRDGSLVAVTETAARADGSLDADPVKVTGAEIGTRVPGAGNAAPVEPEGGR